MPVKMIDPTIKAQGAMASPLAAMLSNVVAQAGANIPTAQEAAAADYATAKAQSERQKMAAAGNLADVFNAVYNAQPTTTVTQEEGPKPQGFVGPMPSVDKTVVTQPEPIEMRVQKNLPELVRAVAESGEYSQIGNLMRAFTANAPELKDTKLIDRSMLGAGDAYGSTMGGFREAESNKMARTIAAADRVSGRNGGAGKPPTGYMWGDKDPQTGDPTLKPIPGGPGTDMSAELAGRIGIAQSFLQEYKALRSEIEQGKLSGPKGVMGQVFRAGDPGRINRRILTGVDALRRMLTGAGMPPQEAEEYVQRYQPEISDREETKIDKLDGLARELVNTYEVATRGRRTPAQASEIEGFTALDTGTDPYAGFSIEQMVGE